jgi:hypothetical protein
MTDTEIDGRLVPIEPGPKTIIGFSGGRGGPSEAGDWEFWTAVGPMESRKDGTPIRRKTAARCRPGADPGERFRRMENNPAEAEGWEIARRADYLRPSVAGEVQCWLNHPSKRLDAPHAGAGEIGGAKVRVVKEGGRYRVVSVGEMTPEGRLGSSSVP